jgi:magnesium transporter
MREKSAHVPNLRRPKLFSISRRSQPGAAPGTLITPPESTGPVIDALVYTKEEYSRYEQIGADEVQAVQEKRGVSWVDVTGLGDADVIENVAAVFGLHQLAIEDVLNLHQRPKVEEFEDHLFIVVRMVTELGSSETEQVSVFLGEGFVLSIQERPGDCLDPVRARAMSSTSRLRNHGADYLAYAIIDAVVDGFFPVLEQLGEEIEQLEDSIVTDPRPEFVEELHAIKRRLLGLRRAVWPLRELLGTLTRAEHKLLESDTQLYLRDCYDHSVQLMDLLETYRETASSLMDVYMSSVSTKLNETMKVLTIIATLFIPLSFIASLYGMNFDGGVSPWNMPELKWRFGYPLALGLMAACAITMLAYFWRNGWIGNWKRDGRKREN